MQSDRGRLKHDTVEQASDALGPDAERHGLGGVVPGVPVTDHDRRVRGGKAVVSRDEISGLDEHAVQGFMDESGSGIPDPVQDPKGGLELGHRARQPVPPGERFRSSLHDGLGQDRQGRDQLVPATGSTSTAAGSARCSLHDGWALDRL